MTTWSVAEGSPKVVWVGFSDICGYDNLDSRFWSVAEGSLMRICDVTFGDNGGSAGLVGVVVVLLQQHYNTFAVSTYYWW